MQLDNLIDQLNAIYPMSEALKEDLISNTEIIEIQKKEILVAEGQTIRHLYFVLNGLLRVFYIKDGLEVNARFSKQGDVIFSIAAFYHQQPENTTIEAIENTSIAKLSFEKLASFYKKHLELNYIARVISDTYLLQNEQRLFMLRKLSTKERWEQFSVAHPDLIQRISLQHIASYLGMNLETLSRVRK